MYKELIWQIYVGNEFESIRIVKDRLNSLIKYT